MSDNEWLQQLKVGDKVWRTQSYGLPAVPCTVSRITATQIIVKGSSYHSPEYEERHRKADGYSIGSERFSRQFLRQDTPELKDAWDVVRMTNRARKMIERIELSKDTAGLQAFMDAIKPWVK